MKSSEISVPAAPSESSAAFPPDSAIPIRQSAIPNPVLSTSGESGTAAPLDSAIPIPQSPIPTPQSFPRRPGETPRAFSAFTTYFQLGHARSLHAVADKLGENLGTVKNWSSKYDWSERLQAYHSGLLLEQAQEQALLQRQQIADWNRRLDQFREQEWEASQKLIAAAHCFLETFGEEDLRRMTLTQVARALKVSSTMARSALTGAELPAAAVPELSPLQQQLLAGVSRVYGVTPPASPAEPST